MQQIKGIIFDMDGLMIDTEKLLQRYWCQAANEFGYPMKKEHVLKIRSLSAQYAIPKLKEMLVGVRGSHKNVCLGLLTWRCD